MAADRSPESSRPSRWRAGASGRRRWLLQLLHPSAPLCHCMCTLQHAAARRIAALSAAEGCAPHLRRRLMCRCMCTGLRVTVSAPHAARQRALPRALRVTTAYHCRHRCRSVQPVQSERPMLTLSPAVEGAPCLAYLAIVACPNVARARCFRDQGAGYVGPRRPRDIIGGNASRLGGPVRSVTSHASHIASQALQHSASLGISRPEQCSFRRMLHTLRGALAASASGAPNSS